MTQEHEETLQNHQRVSDDAVFQQWLQSNNFWHLHLHGGPNTGKTVLCQQLAQFLRQQYPDLPTISLGEQEINHPDNGSGKHETVQILHNIRRRIVIASAALADDRTLLEDPKLSEYGEELVSQLQDELERLIMIDDDQALAGRGYLVVDGIDKFSADVKQLIYQELCPKLRLRLIVSCNSKLDSDLDERYCDGQECTTPGRGPLEVYWRLQEDSGADDSDSFELCSSCKSDGKYDPDLVLEEPYEYREISVKLEDYEMADLVQWEFQQPSFAASELGAEFAASPGISRKVAEAIASRAEGNILVAKHLVDALYYEQSYEHQLATADHLTDFEIDGFRQSVRDLACQGHDDAELALRALGLLCGLKEGVHVRFDEFIDALIFLYGNETESSADVNRSRLLTATRGLVTINVGGDGDVHFVSPMFELYLREHHDATLAPFRIDVGRLCVRYLQQIDFSALDNEDEDVAFVMVESYPFSVYAVQHWAGHVKNQPGEQLQQATMDLLQDNERLQAMLQIAWNSSEEILPWSLYPGSNALHICAWFGLDLVFGRLRTAESLDVNTPEPGHGDTPLILACRQGHEALVSRLMDEPSVDVRKSNRQGITPLEEAIGTNNANKVRSLLMRIGATDINRRMRHKLNRTALHQAASSVSNVQSSAMERSVVETLLKDPDVEVNVIDKMGFTPLMLASSKGHLKAIRALLQRTDIDICFQDRLGRSVLHIAAESTDTDLRTKHKILDFLCKHAKQRELAELARLQDNRGLMVLMVVVRNARQAIIEPGALTKIERIIEMLIKKHDADPRRRDVRGRTIIHYCVESCPELISMFVQNGVSVDTPDTSGWRPLHQACRYGLESAVQILLEHHANIYAIDKEGDTAMDVAEQFQANTTVLEKLREYDRNDPAKSGPRRPMPPRRSSLARMLMAQNEDGIEETAVDRDAVTMLDGPTGNNALHWAVLQDRSDVLEKILETKWIDINDVNLDSETPLHIAVRNSNLEALKILLTHKPNLEQVDWTGGAALSIACSSAFGPATPDSETSTAIAVLLVEAGADVEDLPPTYLQQLFFAAIRARSLKAVTKLIVAEIDIFARDTMNKLAKHLAAETEDLEIIELVRAATERTLKPDMAASVVAPVVAPVKDAIASALGPVLDYAAV